MTPQDVADTRLIADSCTLEPTQYVCIKPQRHELLGIVRFWTAAADEFAPTAMICVSKPIFSEFGYLVIFVRLHDMTINFLQVASQSALSRGHLLSSSKSRAARCCVASRRRSPSVRGDDRPL